MDHFGWYFLPLALDLLGALFGALPTPAYIKAPPPVAQVACLDPDTDPACWP
jgi:hypothetical protein